MPKASTSSTSASAPAAAPKPGMADLLKVCGCAQDAIDALENAGIKSIGDVITLKEEDVSTICKIIRKESISFPFLAEKNLKLVVSEAQIRRQTFRNISAMYSATAEDLIIWHARQQEKKAFKDPTEGKPDIEKISKSWPKAFDQLEHWIGLHVDEASGIPLAFAVRVGPPDEDAYNHTKYGSLFEQYAKRCRFLQPVSGDPYEWAGTVKAKVWNILYGIFKDHAAFQYMRPFQKTKDGPAAYAAVRAHYLGLNNVNNIAADIDSQFSTLTYSTETRRWNFEKYVGKHVELYNIAQDLVPHGYSGIDNASRVRKLLTGIKTDTLDTVRTQILSDQKLSCDFDRCVNLFKDFIAQKKAMQKPNGSADIAAANASSQSDSSRNGRRRRGNNSNGDNGGNRNTRRRTGNANVSAVNVEDRFYSPEEYAKLSQDQKKALHELRKKRRNNGNNSSSANVSSMSGDQLVQAIVSAVQHTQTNSQQSNGTNDDATTVTSNRDNPALRQPNARPAGRS